MSCWRLYLNYDGTESCQICFPSTSRSFRKSRLSTRDNGGQQIKNIKWDLRKTSQGGNTWSSPNEIPRALWKHLKALSWSVKGFLQTRFTKQQKVTPVSHLAELPMISPHSRLLRLAELEALEFMNSCVPEPLPAHLSWWGHAELFQVSQTSPQCDCGLLPALPATPGTQLLRPYKIGSSSFSRV